MATTPHAGRFPTSPRNRYRPERRIGKLYNALTGRLQQAWVIMYHNPNAMGGPTTTSLPGTWTRTTAYRIAALMNQFNK